MNYPEFLKRVDATIAMGDKDKLGAFVHEMARTSPEEEREQFLLLLNNYCTSSKGEPSKKK